MFLFQKFAFGSTSSSSAKNKSTSENAIQKLRETEEMLLKKQEHLEQKIANEVDTARKNATLKKRKALQALKRKKRYEKELRDIDGALNSIEMQRMALESAHTNTAVLNTMSEAAKALKITQQKLDVDKVNDMMDDIAEQQEVAEEISTAISNPTSFGAAEVDSEELERELEQLEQGNLDESLTQVPDLLPPKPRNNIDPARVPAEEESVEEMKQLADWAN